MQKEYDIVIDTPKHHYRCIATVNYKGTQASAKIEIPDVVIHEAHGTRDGNDFEFTGSVDTEKAGTIEYIAKGQLWGNSLDFKAETNIGGIVFFGNLADTSSRDSRTIDEWQGGGAMIDYLL